MRTRSWDQWSSITQELVDSRSKPNPVTHMCHHEMLQAAEEGYEAEGQPYISVHRACWNPRHREEFILIQKRKKKKKRHHKAGLLWIMSMKPKQCHLFIMAATAKLDFQIKHLFWQNTLNVHYLYCLVTTAPVEANEQLQGPVLSASGFLSLTCQCSVSVPQTGSSTLHFCQHLILALSVLSHWASVPLIRKLREKRS